MTTDLKQNLMDLLESYDYENNQNKVIVDDILRILREYLLTVIK